MRFYHYSLFLIVSMFLSIPTVCCAADWSPWLKLDDGALNGIEFSHKNDCPPGEGALCKHWWRFNSGYESPVPIEYVIEWEGAKGVQKKSERVTLQPGENSLAQFTLNGKALEEVSVKIIADESTLAAARQEAAAEQARRDNEQKRNEEMGDIRRRIGNEESSQTVVWSDWKTLDDTANNGIAFSYKCFDGICIWRWKSDYTQQVQMNYVIKYDGNGKKTAKDGVETLSPGVNQSESYSLYRCSQWCSRRAYCR